MAEKRMRGPAIKVRPERWWSPISDRDIQVAIYHFYWEPKWYDPKKEYTFFLHLIRRNVRPYLVTFPDGVNHYYIKVSSVKWVVDALKSEIAICYPTFNTEKYMSKVPINARAVLSEISLPSMGRSI